jgi:hypothetical protein
MAYRLSLKKPWREILFMAVLFVWGLYKLITEGFR